MNKEYLLKELYYIIITIVLYLGSFYLKVFEPVVIYLLVRICFKGWFDRDE